MVRFNTEISEMEVNYALEITQCTYVSAREKYTGRKRIYLVFANEVYGRTNSTEDWQRTDNAEELHIRTILSDSSNIPCFVR